MNRESYLRQRGKTSDRDDTRHSDADGDVRRVSPLDSDEQEVIVAAIAQDANNQAALFAKLFSGFLLLCGFALVRCSLELLLRGDEKPWPHRAVFEVVPDVAFHATYAGQLLGLYLAHRVAWGSGWHIAPGFMVSWTSLFSWLAVFRHVGVTNPVFFWMPFGPAVVLAAAVYLFTSRKDMERKVEDLKGARYNHKEL